MTEHNNEPLWVGMDVDAELSRYAAEEEPRAETLAPAASGPNRPALRRSLRAALPALGKGGAAGQPLAV